MFCSNRAMQDGLTIDQQWELLISSLQDIARLPVLGDQDFADVLFEDVDLDAYTFLSDEALGRFSAAGLVTNSEAEVIRALRVGLLGKITELHQAKTYDPEVIRGDPLWHSAAAASQAILDSIRPAGSP